jgi:hypothetical protein
MILEVPVKTEWFTQARKESVAMGRLRESITSGAGNVAGFLGEIVVQSVIGGERKNTFDYDLIKPPHLIDIKTKRCTSAPQPHYACSIAAYNPNQRCTTYVFTRVLETNYKTCWILGYIDKDEYFKVATLCRKGEVDPTDTRGWRFKADCFNLPISKLKDIHDLRN